MTSSSWQTARHRIGITNFHYTPVEPPLFQIGGRRGVSLPAVKILADIALARGDVRWRAWPAQQVPVFRAGVDLVNFGVTVIDRKGELVAGPDGRGLRGLRGRPPADDPVLRARRATRGRTIPRRRCTSACCSTSAAAWARTSRFTQTAAVKFLNTLLDAVDITLVDFDTEVRVARYSQADFARLVERIRRAEGRAG